MDAEMYKAKEPALDARILKIRIFCVHEQFIIIYLFIYLLHIKCVFGSSLSIPILLSYC